MSLRALRQAVRLTHGSGHPSSLQDFPLALSAVEDLAPATVVAATSAPSPPLTVPIREVTSATRVSAPTTSVGSIIASSSTIVTPLLSVNVETTSAPMM